MIVYYSIFWTACQPFYFTYFGITTSKFNSIIKDQIRKQNDDIDIDLKKVKLHLDLKNISIKIKITAYFVIFALNRKVFYSKFIFKI